MVMMMMGGKRQTKTIIDYLNKLSIHRKECFTPVVHINFPTQKGFINFIVVLPLSWDFIWQKVDQRNEFVCDRKSKWNDTVNPQN
jgi:hypothetical protein